MHISVVASSNAQEFGLPCCSPADTRKQCHPASGAALVMQYVDDRVEAHDESEPDAVADLTNRIQQLESRLSTLMTYTGQLEETVRHNQST